MDVGIEPTQFALVDPLAELLPPYSAHEAAVEANRCLYCYDAPCTHACPTHIDVPRFIKKIASGNLIGSASAIFESNLLGASCARVCPVQELCEGACVLGADHRPIAIGRLQRYAMDDAYARHTTISPGVSTGKKVAVVGAGPAGLSCAGHLAKLGQAVTVYEKRALPGGLSTYGIIALREPVDIALAEARFIESMGVKFEYAMSLGANLEPAELLQNFDSVFLAVGLGWSPELQILGEEHVVDGLAYIEQSKMDAGSLHVGKHVAVIGAGNTAIDCATVAKRLGAESVTMVYRRTAHEMTAYQHEYEFIKSEGVVFQFLAQPIRVVTHGDRVAGLECVRMALGEPDASGRASARPVTGSEFVLQADQIVKAIGQKKPPIAELLNLETKSGFLKVDEQFQTSRRPFFAGGDCVRASGSASTVMAVQDGKLAAAAIHSFLMEAPLG